MLVTPLEGLRIALLETHLSEQAADYVRRFGGTPHCVGTVRELAHADRIGAFIDRLSSGELAVVVFMTGVGATVLLEEAARLGRLQETTTALRRATVACRGPKPATILSRHDVQVDIAAAEPYTTKQLLEALTSLDVGGKTVALVHHGERNVTLSGTLIDRGARIEEFLVYEWAMPEDLGPLEILVREIVDGRIHAVAFTNRIQCRHLLRVAAALGLEGPLTAALNADIVVAAVGPVCADALQSAGIVADVIPARPNMESMIGALAEYFELTHGLPD